MENIERYEAGIAPARDRFGSAPAIQRILSPEVDPDVLEAFFIYFSALGVGMTEHVEGWIRRAGERCVEIGITELGNALQGHAKAEADHHLLMIDDLRKMCARRNQSGRSPLDPDELLALPLSEPTVRYRKLHEDVIAGPTPYAQIAIENEIEMLSVDYGPGLLDNCRRLLGEEVVDDLSFLTDHVELDAGHTKFNRRQMASFLDDRPEAVEPLVEAGSAALDAYRDFLTVCVLRAVATPAPVG
jgi:hypothetical protein